MPHSKTCDTFRASDASAVGTGLGSPSFVGFNISRSVPAGFIAELIAQHRPTRVQNGLRHSGFHELGRADIADDDQFFLTSKLRAPLMQVMLSGVRDFGVDRADALLVPSALSNSKCRFIAPIMLERGNNSAIRTCGDGLEPEVNADGASAGWKFVFDFALEANVPATSGILDEASCFQFPFDLAGFPEVEFTPEIDDVWAIKLDGSGNKRHPTEGAFCSAAPAPAKVSALGISASCIFSADGLHSIGVQPEFSSGAGAQFDQIESGWPPYGLPGASSALGFALGLVAIIPDEIDSASMPDQMLFRRRVLDAEFECDDAHRGSQAANISLDQERVAVFPAPGAFAFCTTEYSPFQYGNGIDCELHDSNGAYSQ